MNDAANYFITWTTYGTWLPGDLRGWRKTKDGNQPAQPQLAAWSRDRLSENPVLLTPEQRTCVEDICRKHAEIRGWILHAVNARSNHIHIAVTADKPPQTVRDQFKANATRVLRQAQHPIANEKVWTRGGDCEVIEGDDNLKRVVEYIEEQEDK